MEVARRASERDVPVLFVHPRADMVLSRQIRIGGASQNEAVRGVRKLVNKHADKAWYQLSENDRRVYIVSSLDIERGNEGTFDEADLVAKCKQAEAAVLRVLSPFCMFMYVDSYVCVYSLCAPLQCLGKIVSLVRSSTQFCSFVILTETARSRGRSSIRFS